MTTHIFSTACAGLSGSEDEMSTSAANLVERVRGRRGKKCANCMDNPALMISIPSGASRRDVAEYRPSTLSSSSSSSDSPPSTSPARLPVASQGSRAVELFRRLTGTQPASEGRSRLPSPQAVHLEGGRGAAESEAPGELEVAMGSGALPTPTTLPAGHSLSPQCITPLAESEERDLGYVNEVVLLDVNIYHNRTTHITSAPHAGSRPDLPVQETSPLGAYPYVGIELGCRASCLCRPSR